MRTLYVSRRVEGKFQRVPLHPMIAAMLRGFLHAYRPNAFAAPQSKRLMLATRGKAGRFERVHLLPAETAVIERLLG